MRKLINLLGDFLKKVDLDEKMKNFSHEPNSEEHESIEVVVASQSHLKRLNFPQKSFRHPRLRNLPPSLRSRILNCCHFPMKKTDLTSGRLPRRHFLQLLIQKNFRLKVQKLLNFHHPQSRHCLLQKGVDGGDGDYYLNFAELEALVAVEEYTAAVFVEKLLKRTLPFVEVVVVVKKKIVMEVMRLKVLIVYSDCSFADQVSAAETELPEELALEVLSL